MLHLGFQVAGGDPVGAAADPAGTDGPGPAGANGRCSGVVVRAAAGLRQPAADQVPDGQQRDVEQRLVGEEDVMRPSESPTSQEAISTPTTATR